MKISTASIGSNILRNGLSVVLAIGAFALLSARVHADDLDPITISAPTVKTVGRELGTQAPIEERSVKARITPDAETLTMDSGVVLLKDRVIEAAVKACNAADPLEPDDGECVLEAVKAAQPQVRAAIAQARSNSATG
jgi:UrcA family protein